MFELPINQVLLEGVDVTEEWNQIKKDVLDKARERIAKESKPKPEDPIEHVAFNVGLERTIVKWKDGTVTMVHCAALDDLDFEKAIALCFMKKAYDNRGCYNDFLRYWIENMSIHE